MHGIQACLFKYILLLHSAFMLSVVKMPLKADVGGLALNRHGNYIVDLGKSWNCVSEFLWEPWDLHCLSRPVCYKPTTVTNQSKQLQCVNSDVGICYVP